jgi:hypothetical protein
MFFHGAIRKSWQAHDSAVLTMRDEIQFFAVSQAG